MTYFIYDAAVLAVLLLFVWLGYRKGLVLTLCSLLAVFVAFIGASILSNALAEPVAKAIEPVVASRPWPSRWPRPLSPWWPAASTTR